MWSKIPGFCEPASGIEKLGPKLEITFTQLQHVLPWPDRIRITQHNRLFADDSAHNIRYKPVYRPVTAADRISASRSRNGNCVAAKVPLIQRRDHFRASLAGAVWVKTTQRIDFAIGPKPVAIFVHLIRGYAHESAHRSRRPSGL